MLVLKIPRLIKLYQLRVQWKEQQMKEEEKLLNATTLTHPLRNQNTGSHRQFAEATIMRNPGVQA